MSTEEVKSTPIVIEKHPSYSEMNPLWEKMYTTCELGEDGVKRMGTLYLPKTEGQVEDADEGEARYQAYKTRATYYNFPQRTVKKAMGLLHSKDATLTCGKKIEAWSKNMTIDQEDLSSLARDINTSQLVYGRMGMLLDYPSNGGKIPYVSKYSAQSILCWYEEVENNIKEITFVLLDESGYEFNKATKKYESVTKLRILALDENKQYYTGSLTEKEWNSLDMDKPDKKLVTYPKVKNKRLNYIPFVPVNIKTTTMAVERPLLVELANLALSAYRSDADYRQGLYLQAFALLYLIGFDEKDLKKKGVRSDGFVHTDNAQGQVGYASAPADGLTEMRMSIESLKTESEGNGIVISDKQGVESGKALSTRISLQTSDLRELALTCGEGINKILKMASEWIGDATVPVYTPNLDFKQEKATPREYLDLWNVCAGGGTSLKNVYFWAVRENMAVESTYEDWLANIQESMNILGFTYSQSDSNIEDGTKEDNEDATTEGEE